MPGLVGTFKNDEGVVQKCLGRRSFVCLMCLWLLFLFVISSPQPHGEMFAGFDKMGVGGRGGGKVLHAGTHVDVIDSRHLSIMKAHRSHGG